VTPRGAAAIAANDLRQIANQVGVCGFDLNFDRAIALRTFRDGFSHLGFWV
jgi:hypothetical protein